MKLKQWIVRLILSLIFSFWIILSYSQAKKSDSNGGIIAGNVLDDKKKPIPDATIELIPFSDTLNSKSTITDRNGDFTFSAIRFGWYKLKITYIGYQPLVIDSIHVRAERYDFNLPDITPKQAIGEQLQEVIVYAEKPLIQSKEGNITFNASESPLSAGSNASELLKNVPLVATDPDGKLSVRGKEPKVLIDEKPLELNAQQLQDFLESLPGSMIERIEVMTNPPPQYANEQGGVINIVTRKGRVGIGGRLSISGGTRGEVRSNGNFNYRLPAGRQGKKGLAINFNAGVGYNRLSGNGYSKRQNIYADSTNYFNTSSGYNNRSTRPNGRLSIDYDINSRNILNILIQFNQNIFRNHSDVEYTNLDRYSQIYKLSNRSINTRGQNVNPNLNLTYTHKGKKAGETLRLIAGANYSYNENDRLFFQQFMNPDHSPNGVDSTQQQLSNSWNQGYTVRINYDKLLSNKKTSFASGIFYSYAKSHVLMNSQNLIKPDNIFVKNDLLSNDFQFRQHISTVRLSLRQIIADGMSITAGLAGENTSLGFDLYQVQEKISNNYFSWLPFANFNKAWKEVLNLTLAYRRTIRRPGINELNPSIDYGDPYNIRFGNIYLEPATSQNFDLVLGRTRSKYYLNLGLGYNLVQDIYAQIRTLQSDGKTQITWQNIDDRMEYEISTWSGYTASKKVRLNLSASYTYNQYSEFDKTKYRYRNGGSFTSNLNSSYTPDDLWNFNANLTFNRFANPQGTVRSNLSMNLGIQRKFFNKKFIVTVNAIDPIITQRNRVFTYGSNFNLESFTTSQTKNFRLTLGYNFTHTAKTSKKQQREKENLKKILQKS